MLLTDSTVNNSAEETDLHSYWQVGVENILADNAEDAQAAFLMPFLAISSAEEEEALQASLLQYLATNAHQQQEAGSIDNAYKILRLGQDIFPNDLNNLLRLIGLSLQSQDYDPELLQLLPLLIASTDSGAVDQGLMLRTIRTIFRLFDQKNSRVLAENFLPELITIFLSQAVDKEQAIKMLAQESFLLGHQRNFKFLRAMILELCIRHCQGKLLFDILCQASGAAAEAFQYDKSLHLAEAAYAEGQKYSPEHLVIASYYFVSSLMEAGRWSNLPSAAQQHLDNIKSLIDQDYRNIEQLGPIIASCYGLSYFYDQPRMLHKLRDDLGRIYGAAVLDRFKDTLLPLNNRANYSIAAKKKVLKIGYIASTLSSHSVGWLSRWLFAYHSHQDFQVFIYNVSKEGNDSFNQKYFQYPTDTCYFFGSDVLEIVGHIRKDEIDILVDMDSLTLSITCEVMCCRPAPIQLTWLGWDTSGCPEIDYFIADPHVLPADAQEYYQPQIWRLPNTYIAVDGFESDAPTMRREDYGIPTDAIVYLCGQKSYKHHPDILRLQMQILRAVPNSYLLVKVMGDKASMMATYQELAAEVGIDVDRLRFLDRHPTEYIHRANLHIADVVLDTFPYNGATTTLETIWAGVPMVTKVGESFVARNSYAFLTNAGIAEGIAHNDEEYVSWGIKLGTNLELRQQVSGKMLQSRKTSPLWNAKQFTRDMESAYRQMWEIYQDKLAAEQNVILAASPAATKAAKPIKLHIGGTGVHPDWQIMDALERPEVDFVGNAKDLSQFADNSIDTIYASHVLEHFHYQLDGELAATLKEWWRVLQPGGQLMVSVPNLQVICALYADPQMPVDARHHLMRMIFGGQMNEYDVHKVGFDADTLSMYLKVAGFREFKVVEEFGLFQDCSSLRFADILISLNMIAIK
jgi:predicted O-linked N-acetylglucosamine transferase (SPINDLY family)/predicted SAM-dependent methyltransferase